MPIEPTSKVYNLDGENVVIPIENADAFYKANPKAKEMVAFDLEGEKVAIPAENAWEFVKANQNAKPLHYNTSTKQPTEHVKPSTFAPQRTEFVTPTKPEEIPNTQIFKQPKELSPELQQIVSSSMPTTQQISEFTNGQQEQVEKGIGIDKDDSTAWTDIRLPKYVTPPSIPAYKHFEEKVPEGIPYQGGSLTLDEEQNPILVKNGKVIKLDKKAIDESIYGDLANNAINFKKKQLIEKQQIDDYNQDTPYFTENGVTVPNPNYRFESKEQSDIRKAKQVVNNILETQKSLGIPNALGQNNPIDNFIDYSSPYWNAIEELKNTAGLDQRDPLFNWITEDVLAQINQDRAKDGKPPLPNIILLKQRMDASADKGLPEVDNIKKSNDERIKQLENKWGKYFYADENLSIEPTPEYSEALEEWEYLSASNKQTDLYRKVLENKGGTGLEYFKNQDWGDILTFGHLKTEPMYRAITKVEDKLRKGVKYEELSDTEKNIHRLNSANEILKSINPLSTDQEIAEALTGSIQLMEEFILSGGLAGFGEKLAIIGIARLGEYLNALRIFAKPSVLKSVDIASKIVGGTANIATRTIVSPTKQTQIAEAISKANGLGIDEIKREANITNFVQNFVELYGGELATKYVSKFGSKKLGIDLTKSLSKIKSDPTILDKIVKLGAVHGVGSETLETYGEPFLDYLATGDSKYLDFYKDFHGQAVAMGSTILLLGAPSVTSNAYRSGKSQIDLIKRRKQYLKSEANLPPIIKNKLILAMGIKDPVAQAEEMNKLSMVMNTLRTPEEKKAVYKYIFDKGVYDVVRTGIKSQESLNQMQDVQNKAKSFVQKYQHTGNGEIILAQNNQTGDNYYVRNGNVDESNGTIVVINSKTGESKLVKPSQIKITERLNATEAEQTIINDKLNSLSAQFEAKEAEEDAEDAVTSGQGGVWEVSDEVMTPDGRRGVVTGENDGQGNYTVTLDTEDNYGEPVVMSGTELQSYIAPTVSEMGSVQNTENVDNANTPENQTDIEAKKAEIERRRQEELKERVVYDRRPTVDDGEFKIIGDPNNRIFRVNENTGRPQVLDESNGLWSNTEESPNLFFEIVTRSGFQKSKDKINAKYDAELKALEQTAPITEEQTETPVAEQTSTPETQTEPQPEKTYPVLKNGEPDYNNMNAQQLYDAFTENLGEESVDTFNEVIKNLKAEKSKIDKKRPTKPADIVSRKKALKEIEAKIKEHESVRDAQLMQRETNTPAPKKIAKRVENTNLEGLDIIKNRWENSPKVYGRKATRTIQNGDRVKGVWVLHEAGASTPSHNPFTFEKNAGFPTNEQGETINSRDYKNSEKNKNLVESHSNNLDARAYQNDVMVSKDGVVVSGNDRTMSRIISAEKSKDKKYKEDLRDDIESYGIPLSEYEKMLNELSDKTKKQAKTTVVRSNADAIVQMKNDKVDTAFIQAFQDVVANGHKPEAIMTNNGLYIVSSNIKDTQRAVEVWFHEQAGHYGIRLIMPDTAQRKAFFTDIYNSVGEANIRKELEEGYDKITDKAKLGEEYFGRVCEKVAKQTSLNELEYGVWDKFLTKLREFISNLLPSAKLSQGQIESIAKASIQNIIEVRQKTDIQARQKTADIEVKTDNVNTNPTEAQKEAGNYAKAKISIQGLQITIENTKGSVRSGTDREGNEWFVEMNNDYGYFNGTKAKDWNKKLGKPDEIDVFIGDNPTSKKVFVIDQVDTETREFDESKVMLGFDTIEDAELNYLLNYEAGWQGMGKITEVDMDTFKTWLNDGKRQLKPFGEYKQVKEQEPKQTPESKLQESQRKAIDELQSKAVNAKPVIIVKDNAELLEKLKAENADKETIEVVENLDKDHKITGINIPNKHIYIVLSANEGIQGITETWFHEQVGHYGIFSLFPDTDKQNKLFTEIYDQIGHKAIIELVGDSYDSQLKNLDDDNKKILLAQEYVARIAEKLDANEALTAVEQSTWDKIIDYLNKLLESITKGNVKWTEETVRDLAKVSARKLAMPATNNVTNDDNVNFNIIGEKGATALDKAERRQKQLDIINNTNPMLDDYHTGIRTVGDVKTLEEVVNNEEWDYDEYTPDYTRDMAKKAIESGKITVYSSKPITNGVFISPSKMIAESYSVNGKIYSDKINTQDVAWIDPTEGQYASTSKAEEATTRLDNLSVAKEMESGVKPVLRVDENGRDIVWENNDYMISVNDPKNATYIALWNNGKKVGELFTTKGRNAQTKGYLSVQNVEIQPKHRGNGLSLKMYESLLNHLGEKYKGISSENEQRSNKKQVPKIWNKLNANNIDGNYTVDKKQFTPQEIRMATGWEKGVDGLWRYETEDYLTGVSDVYELEGKRNGEVIQKANVFLSNETNTAYPELKDVYVKINISNDANNTGKFERVYVNEKVATKQININATDVAKAQSILTHEIQHAIQDIEGFAKGGNVEMFKTSSTLTQKLFKDMDTLFDKLGYSDWLKNINNETAKKILKGNRNFNGVYEFAETKDKETRDKIVKKLDRANEIIKENDAIFGKYGRYTDLKDAELYRILSGETEARNAQTRMNYTEEERRAKLLSETADVALEDQIIIMDNLGVSNSESTTTDLQQIKDKALEDGTFMKAPNGNPTNLNERQWLQVRTPEFINWFGDWINDPENASKVVDSNGEPKITYHQTKSEWTIYDKEKIKAGKYDHTTPTGIFTKSDKSDIGLGEIQMPIFTNIKNPLYFRNRESAESYFRLSIKGYSDLLDKYQFNDKKYTKELDEAEVVSGKRYKDLRESGKYKIPSNEWSKAIEENQKESTDILEKWESENNKISIELKQLIDNHIKETDYDGVIMLSDKGSWGRETDAIISIEPTQIKSATSNVGTFDEGNANINFKLDKLTPEQKVKFKENLSEEVKMLNGFVEDMRMKIQDKNLSVRRMQESIEQITGKKILPSQDIYDALEKYSSQVYGRMELYSQKERQNLIDVIGKLGKKYKFNSVEVEDYLLAKHSLERHDSGTNALSEDPEAEWNRTKVTEIINNFENNVTPEELSELWNAVNAVNDVSIRALKDSGFISKEQYDFYKERWQYYVPLRGWELPDDIQNQIDMYTNVDHEGTPVKTQMTAKATKQAKGRTSKPDSPIQYMDNIVYSSMITAEKNKATQKFGNLVRGNKDLTELFEMGRTYLQKVGEEPVLDADGNQVYYKTKVDEEGNPIPKMKGIWQEIATLPDNAKELFDKKEIITRANKDTRDFMKYIPNHIQQKNTVEFYENGNRYIINVKHPDVAQAINMDNNMKLPKAIDYTLGNLNRFISANFTAMNPDFIPVNFIRDVQYAILSANINKDWRINGRDVAKNLPISAKTISRYLTGKADPINNKDDAMYELFMTHGGKTGFIHMKSLDKFKKQLDREMRMAMGTGTKGQKFADKTNNFLKHNYLNTALKYGSEVAENMSRYSVFKSALKKGYTFDEASKMAKNVTVNFNRKGKWSPLFSSLFAFFNASTQGAQNLASLLKHNKGAGLRTIMAFMLAGGIWNEIARMMAGDDDKGNNKYDLLNDYTKGSNIVIPIGDTPITVPLPQGFKVFWAMGQIADDMILGRTPVTKGALKSLDAFIGGFSPIGVQVSNFGETSDIADENRFKRLWRPVMPTPVVPVWDLIMNENYFGSKIYKEPMFNKKYTPSSERGMKNVNPNLQQFTRWLNRVGGGNEFKSSGAFRDLNPSIIEYMAEYFGGGRLKFWNKVWKTTAQIWDEDIDMKAKDLPILGRFTTELKPKNYSEDFNKVSEKIQEAQYQWSNYSKDKDEKYQKEQSDIEEKHGVTYVGRGKASHQKLESAKELEDINKRLKELQDKANSAETKEEEEVIKKEINDLKAEFISKYQNILND